MRVNLDNIDLESFMKHETIWNGEKLYLIQPQHIGCKWTKENKIFRSSVWNEEGELVSAGFPKFTNWGENPEHFPVPTSLTNSIAVEKIDGSLLIVTKYKGEYILRTRGTFDASIHDNSDELNTFFEKYPKAKLPENPSNTWDFSILFEWVSPNNRIVLNYGEKPEWLLVGLIYHHNYNLASQKLLDLMALNLEFKRPAIYNFDSIENLLTMVEEWKGKEGICLYSKEGQAIHKIKSAWYLALHKLKSEISSIEKLVDVYLTWEMPLYNEFEKKIIDCFDYELFEQVRGDVSKICDAKKESDKIVEHMKNKVVHWQTLVRKEAAMDIINSYGQTVKKGIAFSLLDGKELDNKAWKTLILQQLK